MFKIEEVTEWLKKNFNKTDVLLLLGIVGIYFLTRIINIESLPIFTDEAIYIHWAKVAWKDASWRFVSLTDGRQPLQTWATIPFLKLFPDNALLAGRLFGVASGFCTLAGIFTLLFYLFGKRTAFIGSVLYIFTPFFMFYDRMALADSAVNAGFVWILFFSILMVNTQRLDISLLFGLVSGIFLLTKSSIRLFMGLSAFSPILILSKKSSKLLLMLVNYFLLLACTVFLALVLYNVQRLSPFFHFVSQKNLTFVMSFSEFLQRPFSYFYSNFKLIPLYTSWELGWGLIPFAILGLIKLFRKNLRLSLYILLWLLVPYIAISFFSKVLYPRYLTFFGTLIVLYASYFFSGLKLKKLASMLFLVLILSMVYFDYPILFNLSLIHFPPIDRGQYVEGGSSGKGLREIVALAREKSKEKRVILLAEGNFGMAGDAMDVFLKPGDNIFIKGYWPLDYAQLKENQRELNGALVYAVFVYRTDYPMDWPLKLVKQYDKPGGRSSIYLFELLK